MKFNSQIATTIEQSKRLLALGVKRETADMYYFWMGGNEYRLKVDIENNPLKYNMDKTYIPAWSLHRLLCLYEQDYTFKEIYNNAEECYGMLISAIGVAIQEGYINKEYLK